MRKHASTTLPQHAGVLAAFATAAAHPRSQRGALETARASLVAEMGEHALLDAASVAATFAGISRIVDATGLPVAWQSS